MPRLLHELMPFFTGVAVVLFLAYSLKMPSKTAPPPSPDDPSTAPEPLVRNEAAEKEMRALILQDLVIEAVQLYQKTYHVDINTAGHAVTAIAKEVLPPGTVEG